MVRGNSYRDTIDRVTIDIEGPLATITQYQGNLASTKAINPDDLRYIFSEVAFETGLIPSTGMSCVFFGQRGEYQSVIMQVAPRKSNIAYGRSDTTWVNDVPFPHLLFAFTLDIGSPNETNTTNTNNRLKNMKLFALPNSIRSRSDNVYKFNSYGNVYDNGNICWGNVRVRVTDLWSLRGVINAFYSTPFNNDLGGSLAIIRECAAAGSYTVRETDRLAKNISDVIEESITNERY